MPAQDTTPRHPAAGTAIRLEALCNDERSGWLCQSQGNEAAPAVLVTGWMGLVHQLAIECIDFAASPQALAQANAWLTGHDGSWHFGQAGSASWRIILADGAWGATLMTAELTLAEARKNLAL